MERVSDVLIIGSGPAGLTAAIYATRSNLKTFVIAGSVAGGQLMLTTDVEDYPGFPEIIQGPELIAKMRDQAERLGAKIINEDVTKVDLSKKPFKVMTASDQHQSKTLVIATGADAKWLGLESEQRLIGKGVSSCAVCDAPFFKGKKVAVVGGGDSAMREALFLSKIASEVRVIHRRDTLRAFPVLQDRAFSSANIKFIWDSVVKEVSGENKVEGVQIEDVKSGESKKLQIDGLFIAIGHTPNTNFASGDVHDYRYQQAVTAAGAGCMAAMDAEEYLEEEKAKEKAPKAKSLTE